MTKRLRRGVSALVIVGLLQIPHVAVAQSEGIKVHGDWTIDIREPDGTLVSHHEFKNAATASGRSILAQLMGGERVTGWAIAMDGYTWEGFWTVDKSCTPASDNLQHPCLIVDPSTPEQGTQYHKTLQRVVGSGTFELRGSITARTSFNIKTVRTLAQVCAPVGECDASVSGMSSFTEKSVTNLDLHVESQQIVQVKVLISYQ